jgi:hypothetical protein
MPTVSAKQLGQFLIDGGRLLVTRDTDGEVIECGIDPDCNNVHPAIFAIYEKAGLVAPSVANFYTICAIGRERIQRAYTRDARFTKRKRQVTGGGGSATTSDAAARGSSPSWPDAPSIQP